MGIYDREYVRRDEPRGLGTRDFSAVALLIGANVLVYVAMLVTRQGQRYPLEELLSLEVDTLARPWEWWRFITYGFVHDPRRLAHIALNMLGLFFFGRPIEERYGKRELLLLYFLLLAASSLAFVLIERLRGTPEVRMYGASGAVAGILILFALNFPNRQVLLFFVLPTPAWVVAVGMVVLDMLGAMGGERGVAYTAHLTGAALAFAYYRGNWNLCSLVSRLRRWRRPRLRTVRPEMFTAEEADEELERTVDQILAKMSQHGMDSLTAAERRTLEEASRRYRERRR
jgi:membrane associated rhomboid family serine protease